MDGQLDGQKSACRMYCLQLLFCQKGSWIVGTEILQTTKPKIFTILLFTEKIWWSLGYKMGSAIILTSSNNCDLMRGGCPLPAPVTRLSLPSRRWIFSSASPPPFFSELSVHPSMDGSCSKAGEMGNWLLCLDQRFLLNVAFHLLEGARVGWGGL